MKQHTPSTPRPIQPRPLWLRRIAMAALLVVAVVCVFGVLCTFEPNPWQVTWLWRAIYGGLFVCSVAGLFWCRRKPRL